VTAPEVHVRGGNALAPIVLALLQEGFDEQAAGITEDRDQQEHAHYRATNDDALLAEINLQLGTRCRFHPNRRDVGGALRLTHGRDRTLHGTEPDPPSLIAQQPMHDHGIALGHARIERLRLVHDGLGHATPRPNLPPSLHRLASIAPHRISRDS